MTTTPSVVTAAAGGTASSSGGSKSTLDYEAFLKLLTAQLQNQDPLAPMDATQFMTQLAQLSSVEQAIKTNDTMTEVLDQLKSLGMRLDMAYVGRTVEASGNALSLSGGTGSLAYVVDGTPASVKIEVADQAGTTLYSTAGSTASGRQVFSWDGRTAGGGKAADGVYTVRITAKTKAGEALEVATVVTDVVKEVRSVDGEASLVLQGGATVRSADILSAS